MFINSKKYIYGLLFVLVLGLMSVPAFAFGKVAECGTNTVSVTHSAKGAYKCEVPVQASCSAAESSALKKARGLECPSSCSKKTKLRKINSRSCQKIASIGLSIYGAECTYKVRFSCKSEGVSNERLNSATSVSFTSKSSGFEASISSSSSSLSTSSYKKQDIKKNRKIDSKKKMKDNSSLGRFTRPIFTGVRLLFGIAN
ncbi:MAG: hypothetical protein ABEI53_03660 [Candidatus Magasanikbacteria bacterium]